MLAPKHLKISGLVFELILLRDQLPPLILSIFPFDLLYVEQWFSGILVFPKNINTNYKSLAVFAQSPEAILM